MEERNLDLDAESRVRRVVEEVAPELGLNLEDKPRGRKMVGALVPAAHSTQDVDESQQPDAVGEDDDQAIADVLERWEQIQHEEVLEVVGDVVSDPYAAVAATWTKLMDSQSLAEWVDSEEYQQQASSFTPSEGGSREVSDLAITYLGPTLANATYRTEEQGEEGVYLAQSAVFLRKEDDGWRIAAITKHAEVSES